jgi:hypothetical protein
MGVPKDPYGIVDPFEPDPTDDATNNNSFDRATAVPLAGNTATIDSVLSTYDIDVYNLGNVAIGDRLIVDVDIPERVLLNAAIGVFDQVGRVLYLNQEPTEPAGAPLTDASFPAFAPHFEYIVRQATSPLYLAVASLPEQVSPLDPTDFRGYTAGPYTIQVTFQRGGPVPPPVKQVVALQFDDAAVDYPPFEYFGNWSDMPPMSLVGMNGQVLDPAWWRPFIIMERVLQQNQNVNAQFWVDFLDWLTTATIPLPNLANTQATQIYGILANELVGAISTATLNPPVFPVPCNPGTAQFQWFLNNGFPWLYYFGLYLGPGYTAPAQGGIAGQVTPGLGIWNNQLPPGYPTAPDPRFADSISVTANVRQKLQEMYDGINVQFLIVGEDPIPTNVPVTYLYLASNANGVGLLGLAAGIDIGNVNQSDFATIFAGELGYANAWALGVGLSDALVSPPDLIEDLGFIAGHELGHILGLVHTNSTTDVMKRYGGGTQDLMASFSTAPLDSSMFPIGNQDAGLLLLQALGVAPRP